MVSRSSADGECGAPGGGGIVGVEKIWGILGGFSLRDGERGGGGAEEAKG